MDRHAGLEGTEDVHITLRALREKARVNVARSHAMHANRRVSIHFHDRIRAMKLLLRDPDYRDRLAVETDGAPHNVGITAESLLPIAVPEHDDVAGARLVAFA